MKKRIFSFGLSLFLLMIIIYPAFNNFVKSDEPTWADRVNALQTLDETILFAKDAAQIDFASEDWTQLQKAVSDAKELALSAGYYAIRADVNDGHFNTDRYLSRVGSSGENGGASAVLRYKGHGDTSTEKNVFDDDQIWQMTYLDDTKTTFTLCNREGKYLRVTTTDYGGGKLLRVGTLNSSNMSDAYFEIHDPNDDGSCVLVPIDQSSYSNYVIDFTRKTHDFADTASTRPSYLMLAKPLSSVSGKNRCFFEELTEQNADLQLQKETQIKTIKALLLKKLNPISYKERVAALSNLRDAIVLAESMTQSEFRGTVWSQLQSALIAAKELNRNAGYFAVRADVTDGHYNTNRYLSRIGSTGTGTGTSVVLRYKGHGTTADEKTSFDNDQIWQVVYTDDTATVFTLCNKEGNYLLVSATNYADGRLLRTGALGGTGSVPYFTMIDLDETGSCQLAPIDQDSYSGFAVDFTRRTHDYDDNAASRPTNLMLARPIMSVSVRNRCIFEEITELNIELQTQKADMTATLQNLLAQKLDEPLGVETATTLEEALFVAQGARQEDYSAVTWVELQEVIAEAESLVLEQGQFVIGAGVESGHHNEGRYITAAGGHFDSYMTLRYQGKGEDQQTLSSFTSDQIWIKRDVAGKQDVFTLQNLATGDWLSVGLSIGNVGYIVAAYAEPSPVEHSYWTIKNDLLYVVDQEGIVDQAVDFTKITDNVPDTQKQPRTDNYFHTRSASAIQYSSKPLFTRLSNMDNTNLDNAKEEIKTRLINILRRVSGSPLGNLSDLYNDILENDSSLNYSQSDYAALQNAMQLSVATLQSKLYRIEIDKNAAWADTDGYVRFAPIDSTNLSQLWSRETIAGSTDKETFYSFCNAVYGTYLYQSDEQNPAFKDIADFGCYVKHDKQEKLADEPDRSLFSYSTSGNLMPKINNSSLASQVSLCFRQTNGENKVYSDAGQSNEKSVKIEQIQDVAMIMYIAAQCTDTLTSLRSKRDENAETFTKEKLQTLVNEGKIFLEKSDDYSRGSVEALESTFSDAQELLNAENAGGHVTAAARNLAGARLKQAIGGLADRAQIATSVYKERLLNAINVLEKTKNATDDIGAALYCLPCVTAAEKQLEVAKKVLSNAKVSYQTVDQMIAELEDVGKKMVLNKNYITLFQNLEGVRYRDQAQYQPETWEPLYNFFKEAEEIYQSIAQYTNSEIVKCNNDFSGYVKALEKRATITTLQALLSMLKNLKLQKNDFTPETWQPYARYYQEALATVKNSNAHQGTVDTLVNALASAANGLRYQDHDGSLGLFPNALIGYPNNVRDRYSEGYRLGTLWGAYNGYQEAYSEGYAKTMATLKDSQVTEEEAEPEAPVQEVTQTVTTTVEHFYQLGGLPSWLLYVFVGSGVLFFLLFGFFGVLIAKKQSKRKQTLNTVKEEV